MSSSRHQASNDRHEIYEPTSSPFQNQQRQQRNTPTPLPPQPPTPDPIERISSPSSSLHRLRRTPRFEATPSPELRQSHLRAASVGTASQAGSISRRQPIQDQQVLRVSGTAERAEPQQRHRRQLSQHLTEDPDELSSDRPQTDQQSPPALQRTEPHPTVRVSRHTHSAILFALEEALRQPNPFTPDLDEESADMADLMSGGSGPATSNGNGLPGPRRPTAAPAPTGSPGIRGPRMIMQERAAREARQKAEAQRQEIERQRAEQEARLEEDNWRNAVDQEAAGVAAPRLQQPHESQRRGHTPTEVPDAHLASPSTPQPSHQRTNSSRFAANQHIPPNVQSRQNRPADAQPPPRSQGGQQPPPMQPPPLQPPPLQPNVQDQSADATSEGAGSSRPRNSFPHAFERWETLSAHWEGLTSYWIRKLEQNKDDLNRDPVSQQLARQVTDLSAAGANLFHAVVELQRLRASSERKFQRWFFETRAELERSREVNAVLEATLEQERRSRAEAIRNAVDQEQGSSLAQKQLVEMRKELAISRDEARRAWEELGRREQAERDRTASLQNGLPTIVGGVQVVPMTQGMPQQAPPNTSSQHQGQPQQYAEQPYGQPSYASPTHAEGSSGYYRGQQPAGVSEGGHSEGEYVTDLRGNFVLDNQGRRIPVAAATSTHSGSDLETDEYDTPATTNPPSRAHETPATSGEREQWSGSYSNQQQEQDYAGEGYGTPTWESAPRHHHPTRLSDVIEEDDERSRTSASHTGRS